MDDKPESGPTKKSNTVKKKQNLHLAHIPSDENDLLISIINSNDLGWKADTCKLQTHHADYKCDEEKDD